jgi:hypothetical protein
MIDWDQQTPGAQFQQRVVIGTTAGWQEYRQEIILRMVAHFLVNRLPGNALPEVCETMADIFEYHVSRANYLNAAQAPTQELIKANVGTIYERPAFGLAEE